MTLGDTSGPITRENNHCHSDSDFGSFCHGLRTLFFMRTKDWFAHFHQAVQVRLPRDCRLYTVSVPATVVFGYSG